MAIAAAGSPFNRVSRSRLAAPSSSLATSFNLQYRTIGIGSNDDFFKLGNRGQSALGLNVELQLLIVEDRPRADAADGGLNILDLNRS